ncbi:type III secretion system lytic transglycosylase IpgF [Pseudoduganella ginsengisoli]|uniref:Transglycosylase SLT domain-containing protein n=1 Tax=Pseudoduganella ginsengisoli TaxID=1462440 RepID=A0A6L6Q003_9BURK|nr:lytic transglycosylase domain-containing protein [Pseudoduganella ginsengisoli]MTW02739.1 transglycosylase SLT domain-containing protein [Pseudoduganella ginsengisoli]
MQLSIQSFLPLLAVVPGVSSACWEQAAAKHNVPVVWLQAIADVESGMNPAAINEDHRHRTGTVDIGLMQINSSARMLRNLGVTEKTLLDPCTNIDAGARILAEKVTRYGPTWEAIGAYNASCVTLTMEQCLRVRIRYAWRFYRALLRRMGPAKPEQSPSLVAAPLIAVRMR